MGKKGMIEHKLDLVQTEKVDQHRRYYGVNLTTWSLTKDQAHWIYQKVSGLIDEAEQKEWDD